MENQFNKVNYYIARAAEDNTIAATVIYKPNQLEQLGDVITSLQKAKDLAVRMHNDLQTQIEQEEKSLRETPAKSNVPS